MWRSKWIRVDHKHWVQEPGAGVGGTGGQLEKLLSLAEGFGLCLAMGGELQGDEGSQQGVRGQTQSSKTPLVLREVPGWCCGAEQPG